MYSCLLCFWSCFLPLIFVSPDKIIQTASNCCYLLSFYFNLFQQIPWNGNVYTKIVKFHYLFYNPAINFEFAAYRFFAYSCGFRFMNWYFHIKFQATEMEVLKNSVQHIMFMLWEKYHQHDVPYLFVHFSFDTLVDVLLRSNKVHPAVCPRNFIYVDFKLWHAFFFLNHPNSLFHRRIGRAFIFHILSLVDFN